MKEKMVRKRSDWSRKQISLGILGIANNQWPPRSSNAPSVLFIFVHDWKIPDPVAKAARALNTSIHYRSQACTKGSNLMPLQRHQNVTTLCIKTRAFGPKRIEFRHWHTETISSSSGTYSMGLSMGVTTTQLHDFHQGYHPFWGCIMRTVPCSIPKSASVIQNIVGEQNQVKCLDVTGTVRNQTMCQLGVGQTRKQRITGSRTLPWWFKPNIIHERLINKVTTDTLDFV